MIKCGIDYVKDYKELLQDERLGLLTNMSAVDHQFNNTYKIINSRYDLKLLLVGEHGLYTSENAGDSVESQVDRTTGLPVYSLYTGVTKNAQLDEKVLESIDTVVYDIPDIGCRYYTYISTLLNLIQQCAKHHKKLIILDRPNPLGGIKVEGSVLEEDFISIVGCYTIATRYGLTTGELARMYVEESRVDCKLQIIPCTGWQRGMEFLDFKRPWLSPSPNMNSYDTALLYPGVCLLEGTNISEGRGTALPFRIIGAPYINADDLAKHLRKIDIDGVAFTPAYFKPCSSKYKGIHCQGVNIHIVDYKQIGGYKVGLQIIEAVRSLYPKDFQVLKREKRPSFINLLNGNNQLESCQWTSEEILHSNMQELKAFEQRKQKYHIY